MVLSMHGCSAGQRCGWAHETDAVSFGGFPCCHQTTVDSLAKPPAPKCQKMTSPCRQASPWQQIEPARLQRLAEGSARACSHVHPLSRRLICTGRSTAEKRFARRARANGGQTRAANKLLPCLSFDLFHIGGRVRDGGKLKRDAVCRSGLLELQTYGYTMLHRLAPRRSLRFRSKPQACRTPCSATACPPAKLAVSWAAHGAPNAESGTRNTEHGRRATTALERARRSSRHDGARRRRRRLRRRVVVAVVPQTPCHCLVTRQSAPRDRIRWPTRDAV